MNGIMRLLVLGLLLTGAFHAEAQVQVYKDEYVLRPTTTTASDPQLRFARYAELCSDFNVVAGNDTSTMLACPSAQAGVQLEANPTNEKVPYNPATDRCLIDPPVGYECSPNFVMKMVITPDDPLFENGQLWGLNSSFGINAPQAWDYSQGGQLVVADIDTGTDLNHPDLVPNRWLNPFEISGNGVDDDGNGFVDDMYGANMITGGSPQDDNGHGTHTAGTICAAGDNARGVVGVNWSCRIMSLKFLDSSGSGSLFNAVKAIDYVTNMKNKGVPIVLSSNSWSGGGYSQILVDAIARARNAGILFVAAAGNSGINTDVNPAYPASYNLENIISVAATDIQGKKAVFSNFGATSVDLGAPGVGILSTYPNNQYVSLSGTSMAAPHVSGAIMLLKSHDGSLNWQQLKQRTLQTVRPLSALQGKTVTGGLLNVFQMFRPDIQPPPPPKCRLKKLEACFDNCSEKFPNQANKRLQCRQNCREKFNCPRASQSVLADLG